LALSHAAGLPAHRPFYESLLQSGVPIPGSRQAVLAAAAAEPASYPAGTRSVYSDLGFILLGAMVEHAMGDRLDRLARRRLFAPLGLTSLRFFDQAPPEGARDLRQVAPTEDCPVRGRLVRGEVHDLNAFAMGGVAGHAGLFGTAGDVFALSMALCATWRGERQDFVAPEILRTFWQRSGIVGSTWRLGWDGPSPAGSMAGQRLSRAGVGHLAFTGCSLWLDPEQSIAVVTLTNRVHPAVVDDPRFRRLRPALVDAALTDLGYGGERPGAVD
jgi:serine-type D-Ala-D-Ala carboxypeptidase